MARADLSVIGMQGSYLVRQAAAATRVEVGEPMHSVAALTNGAADVNTYVLVAADSPVIGTHKLGGIALKGSSPFSTGTVVASEIHLARPIAWLGKIRGKAETLASVDTEAEILAILQDSTLLDYSAAGAADGGELYTVKQAASADTSGLELVDGNASKGTLDVVVDGRAYRHDVAA